MQHFEPYMCPVQLTLRGEVEPGEPPSTLPTVSNYVHLHRKINKWMSKAFIYSATVNRWEPTSST